MRLIDADELLQKIGNIKVTDDIYNSISQIYENIKNQPTAYDAEKVVAEIEKESIISEGYFMNFTEEVCDIVKRGGLE